MPKPISPNARSPFAGCAILIAAMAVMVFLLVFSTWGLFRQYSEISKFTGAEPAPVELVSLDGRDAEINQLAEKIERFRQDLGSDEAASLRLTPADLNLAIAAYEPFSELRHTFHVLEIKDQTLRIAISFRLNGKPRLTQPGEAGWITTDHRYLNGTLIAKPQLLGREVVLQIESIDVPGATVPREFIGQMSPYRLTERYLTHPQIGPVMAKLTAVELAPEGIVLKRNPGENPADRISETDVDSATSRLFTWFAIATCGFLVFVGILIFIGLRAKAKKS